MDSEQEREKETSFRRRVLTTIESLIDIQNVADLEEHLPIIHGIAWDEVIEERFVNKQCGFPACPRTLSERIKSQMYQIDKKEGKIYEFCKQRNKFCSETCYQKHFFVREQLEEHPLWITGETEMRMKKKYQVPDESFVSPVPEKDESKSYEEKSKIEFVTDSIIAKVQNMKLSEEDEASKAIDSEEPELEMEPYKLTEDDKQFIKSIREFKNANFGAANRKTSKTPTKPANVKLSKKDEKKEEEILARLREKYGNKNAKQKKPPILIDAPEFHPKVKKMVKEKNNWITGLIESWLTDETRNLVREGARPTGGATEQILMDFLSGKKIDEEKLVDLPNLDKYNIKEKRLKIFLHSIRHHWQDLEARLHVTPTRRDLLTRVATTFKLNSENITGWSKRELNTIVISLFLVICLVDVELGDDYINKGNTSPELSAVSFELCGLDSDELTSLFAAINSHCA